MKKIVETFFERPVICSENRSNKRDQHYYAQMVCFKIVYQLVYFRVFPNITIRGTSITPAKAAMTVHMFTSTKV